MAKDWIRYDLLVQQALRGVVQATLERIAKEGLPGNHHFFITFRTNGDGVQVSDALKSAYPDEMTIVLQHQFWGLEVTENGFAVGLSFNKVPETLEIPYSAITMFHDPSVQFVLPFQAVSEESPAGQNPLQAGTPAAASDNVNRVRDVDQQTQPGPAQNRTPPKEPSKTDKGQSERGDVVSLDSFRKK